MIEESYRPNEFSYENSGETKFGVVMFSCRSFPKKKKNRLRYTDGSTGEET